MILFFISCFKNINTGAGGHYYSLLQMKKTLQKDSKIVVFGDFMPQVYETEEVIFIKTSKCDVLQADISSLKRIPGVEVVHIYDIDVALIGSKVAAKRKVPLVCTKPGGPPIKRWSMSFQNQVVFHPFDHQYFKSRGALAPRNLCLIPNRVSWPSAVPNGRVSPFPELDEHVVKLLRVARIGETYKHSIMQAIHLVEKINQEYGPAALALVGKIEDKHTHDEIQELVKDKPYIYIHTEKTYTLSASELIPYADVVVGTGRGLIEGLSYGKLLFFPVCDDSLPCFMDEQSYKEAFYHNFSQRVPKSSVVDPQVKFSQFLDLLKSGSVKQASALSEALFHQDHLVEVGAEKLLDFYGQIQSCERPRDYYTKYFHSRVLNAMKAVKKRMAT